MIPTFSNIELVTSSLVIMIIPVNCFRLSDCMTSFNNKITLPEMRSSLFFTATWYTDGFMWFFLVDRNIFSSNPVIYYRNIFLFKKQHTELLPMLSFTLKIKPAPLIGVLFKLIYQLKRMMFFYLIFHFIFREGITDITRPLVCQ